jgi:hypothetical protein
MVRARRRLPDQPRKGIATLAGQMVHRMTIQSRQHGPTSPLGPPPIPAGTRAASGQGPVTRRKT